MGLIIAASVLIFNGLIFVVTKFTIYFYTSKSQYIVFYTLQHDAIQQFRRHTDIVDYVIEQPTKYWIIGIFAKYKMNTSWVNLKEWKISENITGFRF